MSSTPDPCPDRRRTRAAVPRGRARRGAAPRWPSRRRRICIGVRHHSPGAGRGHARAARRGPARGAAARAARRVRGEWLPWLADPAHRGAGRARRRRRRDGGAAAFYPFADFSPELAAVRWAARNGVEVVAVRPAAGRPRLARRTPRGTGRPARPGGAGPGRTGFSRARHRQPLPGRARTCQSRLERAGLERAGLERAGLERRRAFERAGLERAGPRTGRARRTGGGGCGGRAGRDAAAG